MYNPPNIDVALDLKCDFFFKKKKKTYTFIDFD